MQNANTLKIVMGLALGLQIPASAGSEAPKVESAPANNGDWCSWLQNKPGTLYKNKENPYLQEFQIEGRFQYQAAHVDADNLANDDLNESYDEYRRVRIGAKAKFLQYFGVKYQINLVDDSRNSAGGGDLDWGYSDIDEAYLSFDLGKALGDTPFDELIVNYGRQKFTFGNESHTSSTKLLTVERSAIANKAYGSYRPTGLSVNAVKGDWSFGAALFSSTEDGTDNEELNGWQDGQIFYLNAGYQVNDRLSLGADLVYNNADVRGGEDSVMDYAWAASLNGQYDVGTCGVIGDFIFGDNGGGRLGHNADRDGDFWGVVVMPYYWIIQDKLQLVGQYQYQGSDSDEGVRVNSRYGRADGITNINSGRGDSHHSFYGGLNYYLCGHNAKLQGGVEYQTMDTPGGDFDTLTYVLAFRTFF